VKLRLRSVLFAALIGSLLSLGLPATQSAGEPLPGATLHGIDASVCYFVAVGFDPTDNDCRFGSDFTSFFEKLSRKLTSPEGTANTRTFQSTEVFTGPASKCLAGTGLENQSRPGGTLATKLLNELPSPR
jgi:hypothetical protein